MKINEVEAAVGVTKKNIRFYEEEGLLRPRRDAGNGYRDYSQEDIERLRRIKLLRKLDVPLAEIRDMLEGHTGLTEGMRRHAEELKARERSIAASMVFCRELGEKGGLLGALDVTDALGTLARYEEQGVRFVNVRKVDKKAQRYQGAALGAALFIGMMLLVIGIVMWAAFAYPVNRPPLPVLVLLTGIPAGCIVCVLVVLAQRFGEIAKGEEDAYRDY